MLRSPPTTTRSSFARLWGLELHVTNMARACVVRHEEGTIVRRPNGTFVGMRLPETLSADVRSSVGPPVSSKGWGQGTQRWLYT